MYSTLLCIVFELHPELLEPVRYPDIELFDELLKAGQNLSL